MAQDIRDLFKNDLGIAPERLSKDHEARFEALLNDKFGVEEKQKQGSLYLWLKIAAVFVVLLAVAGILKLAPFSTQTITPQVVDTKTVSQNTNVRLADLSPEFKKVEDYYMASINVELANLNITNDNKELIDAFMVQLEELNTEYQRLNTDLVDIGVNEQTVTAMISNLQLRLELLFKLKNKLTELKSDREDSITTNTI